MSRRTTALCIALVTSVVSLTACHLTQSPELHVLGVQEEPHHEVVFVQVTNPASRAMHLTKLEYTFAAAGEKLSQGELTLARDVPAGAAVVVEVPLNNRTEKPTMLSGKLTAELDQIVQSFSVSAQIGPSQPNK